LKEKEEEKITCPLKEGLEEEVEGERCKLMFFFFMDDSRASFISNDYLVHTSYTVSQSYYL